MVTLHKTSFWVDIVSIQLVLQLSAYSLFLSLIDTDLFNKEENMLKVDLKWKLTKLIIVLG